MRPLPPPAHRHEVHDISKFTTEMHCRLDYTADTQLFIETNDDCWVFADGKLARDLDFGRVAASFPSPEFVPQLR